MRTRRFHGLKRIKIRQSWNKHNLYNLARAFRQHITQRTHYQQKWTAKSTTRAYHGEQVREKQWERMFTSKIRSVVPMDHRYLAAYDGSEQAEGRGSGKEKELQMQLELPYSKRKPDTSTPYMQMTYAPLERRLDTAIFRALFASSARQARQFVIHGHVKVNGKKMIYPSYLLNPGDMFQVDVDSVMFATGTPKTARERRASRVFRKKQKAQKPTEEAATIEGEADAEGAAEAKPAKPAKPAPVAEVEKTAEEIAEDEDTKRKAYKKDLLGLVAQAKSIIRHRSEKTTAKHKQDLRAFTVTVRGAMNKVNRTDVEDLDADLEALVSQLRIVSKEPSARSSEPEAVTSQPKEAGEAGEVAEAAEADDEPVTPEERIYLRNAIQESRDNPSDPSKPYATPWTPRPYMAPFAFIPRYLEVNQNICAAVYLRHPVARPGLAEVPTPFDANASQLAFTWYLRRR